MDTYPKYEKEDEFTLGITVPVKDKVTLSKLLANRKSFEEQLKKLQEKIATINEIIAEAEKLGIKPVPEAAKPEQSKVENEQ